MHYWILRHIHAAIILDAILHILIVGCMVVAWMYFYRFAQIVGRHFQERSLKVVLLVMASVMIYASWLCFRDLDYCATQYALWWGR